MVLSAIGEIKWSSGWVGEIEAVLGYGPDPSRRRGRGKEEKVVRTPRSCLPQRKTKKITICSAWTAVLLGQVYS